MIGTNISIPAPMRSAKLPAVRRIFHAKISIPTPHAGCDCLSVMYVLPPCISPPAPRAGCDPVLAPPSHAPGISIPAPIQGATVQSLRLLEALELFQFPLPARGATSRKFGRNTNQSNFNSRTRVGCDCSGCWTSLGQVSISIPALHIEGYQTPWTRL